MILDLLPVPAGNGIQKLNQTLLINFSLLQVHLRFVDHAKHCIRQSPHSAYGLGKLENVKIKPIYAFKVLPVLSDLVRHGPETVLFAELGIGFDRNWRRRGRSFLFCDISDDVLGLLSKIQA